VVKIHYSDIVKSELRRRDRRVALCVENLFLKVKLCQMDAILSKVSIAVRKRKTGGNILRAGQFRDGAAVNSLVQYDGGYRILQDIRGSPSFLGESSERSLCYHTSVGTCSHFPHSQCR
jgi:hypothetical protein